MEFEWDQANREHLARHKLEPEDAEDAILDEDTLDFNAHRGPRREQRYGVIGKTLGGLILVVIYEMKDEDTIRVVTARPATRKESSIYEQNQG